MRLRSLMSLLTAAILAACSTDSVPTTTLDVPPPDVAGELPTGDEDASAEGPSDALPEDGLDDVVAGVCDGPEAAPLETFFADTFGGCARAGCHGTGAGGLRFTTEAELRGATVDHESTTAPGRLLVAPGDPLASELYTVLLEGATTRMPLGGPYLTAEQLAQIAAWICAGAPGDSVVPGDDVVDGDTPDTADPSDTVDVVDNPTPVLSSLEPTSMARFSTGAILTVTGSGFIPASMIAFDGSAVETSFVDENTLTAHVSETVAAAPGNHGVVVSNPSPGGGSSGPLDFTVVNPAPTADEVAPASVLTGHAASLVITGAGFVPESTVLVDEVPVVTTWESATLLTAAMPAQAAGAHLVRVSSPAPGGGESGSVTVVAMNPVPAIDSLDPPSALVGNTAVSVAVLGAGFVPSSTVTAGDTTLAVTWVSDGALNVTIPASLTAVAGDLPMVVTNAAPGGGASEPATWQVDNPLPALDALDPESVQVGTTGLQLTAHGTGFVPTSVLTLDGAPIDTTWSGAETLTGTAPDAASAVAGTHVVAVVSPGPGGGTSETVTLTATSPTPAVDAVAPAVVLVGSGAGTGLTISVTGSGFTVQSELTLAGAALPTTFVSPTEVTAAVPATALLVASEAAITVTNPAPGGGTSGPVTLTIANPLPSVAAVTPGSAEAGGPDLTLTLSGAGFGATTTVLWDTTPLALVSASATTLTVTVPASSLIAAGAHALTAKNPAPGGGTSGSVPFIVTWPAPSITAVSPASVPADGLPHDLEITGTGLSAVSEVRVNGTAVATALVGGALKATLPSSLTTVGGTLSLVVSNPSPGGGTSDAVTVTVASPAPELTTVTPDTVVAGSGAAALALDGAGFVPGSVVLLDGQTLPTTFTSTSALTATVTSGVTANGGAHVIAVRSPAPGGGTSAALPWIVAWKAPAITSLAPTSLTAGQGERPLTVVGTGFGSATTVTVSGQSRPATLVAAGTLSLTVPAALSAAAGSLSVIVANPEPGGGTSAPASLPVVNPAPTLSTVAPSAIPAAVPSVVTLTGSGFVAATVVTLDGTPITAHLESGTTLTVTLTLPTGGTHSLAVVNPAPGGGTSVAATLTVENPMPTITGTSPASVVALSGLATVTVLGTGFTPGAQAAVNGQPVTTTWLSATSIVAGLPAAAIAEAGSPSLTVTNPAPGGGTSAAFVLPVLNPAPAITTLSPASVLAGSGDAAVTITGAGFVPTTKASVDGAAVATQVVSATRLLATIPVGAVGGSHVVSVVTPAPGGGTATSPFTVLNPAPTLSGITPAIVPVDAAPFDLVVTGSGFNASSKVTVAGAVVATTLVDATTLHAAIPTVTSPTTSAVAVVNPSPGGGTSATQALEFKVFTTPTISGLDPKPAPAGASFTLTVTGSGYQCVGAKSTVLVNAVSYAPSQCSATSLVVTVPALAAGTAIVIVQNPGAITSNTVTLEVVAPSPLPVLSALAPTQLLVGSGAATLSLTGSNFVATSVVMVDGQPRSTTLQSATSLTAALTSADTASVGGRTVTVVTPAPGGGTSAPQVFNIVNPAPTLTSVSPSTVTAGAGAVSVSLSGTGFVAGSTVTLDGQARVTTFEGAGTLTVALLTTDTAVAGAHSLTVSTPTPGGGTSAPVTITVLNPAPAVTSLTPASAIVNSGALTVTIAGTGFVASSTATLDGSSRVVEFKDSKTLTVSLSAADVAATGARALAVVNPAPGGGTSAATFTVQNPAPTLSAITPDAAVAGAKATLLTVTGSGFVASSVVRIDGQDRATTLVGPTALETTLTTADLAAAGTHVVTVTTPGPGGGTTADVTLTVSQASLVLTSVAPTHALAGGGAVTLTLTGSGFTADVVARIDGQDRPTTFVSDTSLSASVTDADTTTGAVHTITVADLGGRTSAGVTFTVDNPTPTLASVSPAQATAGSAAVVVTFTGTGFVAGSVARVDGQARTTTVVSATSLTTTLSPADLATAGTRMLTVSSPTPGGGTTVGVSFTVNNPAPTLASASPAKATAGAGAVTLSITGTGFVSGSTVRFDGQDRATTFVSATTLTAPLSSQDTAATAVHTLTVVNPAPGGGTSLGLAFSVDNPAPSLSSISPVKVTAGSGGLTLTVAGAGFVAGSVVRVDGSDRTTTFGGATSLTAAIPSTDTVTAASHSVTVFTSSPGGGTSAALTLTVEPAPIVLSSISPSSVSAGSGGLTLTVTGSGFTSGAVVRFDGSDRATTFVSGTSLSAALPSTDTALAGAHTITVAAAGVPTSLGLTFTVQNPAPTLSSLNPTQVTAGSGSATISLSGSGFVAGSVVRIDGADRTTTFGSATALTVALPSADTATAGTHTLTVFNATPGGGTSAGLTLTVANPAPSITSIAPTQVTAAIGATSVSVTGTGFVSGSIVRFDGADRVTTFLSATSVTVSLTSSDTASAGSHTLTVVSPAPGGGTSAGVTFSVVNRAPALVSISPATATIGGGTVTLTASGSGFVSGSVVRLDGAARTTTYVSSGSLTAVIPSTDTAAGGTHQITVFSPSPGGGTSGGQTFTVAAAPNPAPTISAMSPCGTVAGAASFTLTITGTGFVSGSTTVTFNGTGLTLSNVTATALQATVPAALVATAPVDDGARVVATNPSPGGGTSPTAIFGVASKAVSFAGAVQPIFTNNCGPGCHMVSPGSGGLYLKVASSSYTELLTDSSGGCGVKRVFACGPLPGQSVLVDKLYAGIHNTSPGCGSNMPGAGAAITATEYQTIIDWIAAGALNN